jgi:G:T-mismatch repair DNA endonuclease (very short patch repair protein)
LKKAKHAHGDSYDYSYVKYLDSKTKIAIYCKKLRHGIFYQVPSCHINSIRPSGCPKCARRGFSKAQIQWLEFLSKLNNRYIQHVMNDGEFTIPTTRYRADGYCEKTNTVYEFHGDYFHGNPKIYKLDELNTLCNTTYGKLYENTVKKEEKIKELGFNLVIIWESDWNAINKSITLFQKRVRLLINNK